MKNIIDNENINKKEDEINQSKDGFTELFNKMSHLQSLLKQQLVSLQECKNLM